MSQMPEDSNALPAPGAAGDRLAPVRPGLPKETRRAAGRPHPLYQVKSMYDQLAELSAALEGLLKALGKGRQCQSGTVDERAAWSFWPAWPR
jgi:hypothetical protein